MTMIATRGHWLGLYLSLYALLCGGSARVAAQEDIGQKVYKSTLKGTVWIWAPMGDGRMATGSGALVDTKKRIIVTNYHVVGEARKVAVVFPRYNKGELVTERRTYVELLRAGQALVGEVVFTNPQADLALIQLVGLPNGAKPLVLAKGSPKPAERVHSLGNPGAAGALWVYTPGSVRQIYKGQIRSTSKDGSVKLDIDAWLILTNSDTNEGDSGGPLVNDKGELVGITQGGNSQARGVSIFVDVREVKAVLVRIGIKIPSTGEVAKGSESDESGETPDKTDKTASAQKPVAKAPTEDPEKAKIRKLAHELVSARANERQVILERLQQSKGSEFTFALAEAIPKLPPEIREAARAALGERLQRMTAKTLREYLQDESSEIRRATALAVQQKEAKDLMKDLVPLLEDKETHVSDAAYTALRALTGMDFGRAPQKWLQFLEK